MGILDKISEIEREISRTQKNKATEYHLGTLKAKLAKYRAQLLEPTGKKGEKGEGTITKTESAQASYEFTTLTCIPGVIDYKGANIQLLDLPGIIEGAAQGKGRGRQVIAVARTADLVLMILDATKKDIHKDLLERELHSVLFREDCNADQFIDVILGNRIYMNCLYVYNKIDQISLEEVNRLARLPHSVVISCEMKLNLDYLLDSLWEHLDLIRVYTKKPGMPPDFEDSIILRNGVTCKHVCHSIHRTLPAVFKYGLVWGTSTKYSPQRIGLAHSMHDEDVIQVFYPRKISRFRFCPYAQQFLKSVPRNASIDCTGRMRRIPIIFDEFICLTMTTQDACIACVNPPRFQPGGDDHIRVEREIFLGKYEAMDKEDLKVCFNVKLDDVITTFGELFKCVFCYKAFGLLLRDLNKLKLNWPDFFKFQDHPDPLACLTPFVIGDKEIYIDHKHLTRNKAIADLFCVRMPRIYEEVLYETKGAAPCGLHDANAMNYANKLQVWSDAWKIMEPPSRRAVLEIPYSLMVGGITSFVAQHMMCENSDDTKPEDKENTDGNPRLFDSIEICKDAEFPFNYKTFAKKDLANFKNFLTVTHDFHIHIAESEKFVRHLMYLIDPEIDTKVTVERRTASNLIGGQNALVLVIGLLLFRRLQWIWEKYRETKNAHNIEEANKEASCSKELSKAQEGEEEVHEIISQEEPNLCEVQSGNTNSREDKKEEISSDHRPKNLHSNAPPQPSPQIRPIDDPFLESFSLLSPNFSILSLNESLDDLIDNDEHDKGIPEEDIKNFQESVPDVLSKREELRQCLKNRFEELCKTVSKGE
ncbi:unnamed protein product [Lepeophtheirus salmonis]|uniref:(salmon louse) hypothetical protein n=1 Tax=Lepeophtheirus salmonis TaxID=72036 RepID=A0A7R8CEW5_LEPSM|nr:unnamed protein product [Lepeophtheirus salmonis]CAF2760737.1 unnamed protein product [Lepeophtheirus salmonis]